MSLLEQYPNLLDADYIEAFNFDRCWTRNSDDRSYADIDVAAALIRTLGNISGAASLLGKPRRSLHNYILRNPLHRELQEDLWESFVDTIEGLHMKVALNGDTTAQKFFLVTKGKERGYSPRIETTEGKALQEGNFKVTREMPTELLQQLLEHRDLDS